LANFISSFVSLGEEIWILLGPGRLLPTKIVAVDVADTVNMEIHSLFSYCRQPLDFLIAM